VLVRWGPCAKAWCNSCAKRSARDIVHCETGGTCDQVFCKACVLSASTSSNTTVGDPALSCCFDCDSCGGVWCLKCAARKDGSGVVLCPDLCGCNAAQRWGGLHLAYSLLFNAFT